MAMALKYATEIKLQDNSINYSKDKKRNIKKIIQKIRKSTVYVFSLLTLPRVHTKPLSEVLHDQ